MNSLPELALIVIFLSLAESKDHVRLKRGMAENSDTDIKFLHVESKVVSRFATTHVRSEVRNMKNEAQEIFFEAQLPSEAFISNFTMEIDGRFEISEVKGKEEAAKDYEKAKSRGSTAGLVAQKPRKTNIFRTSVTVKANGEVKFDLTYQEILVRTHGVYKHVVNILSTQGIEGVKIDVIISERGKLTELKVPKFAPKIAVKTNKELLALPVNQTTVMSPSKKVNQMELQRPTVSYTPAVGKSGQLAVLYDVERTAEGGEIEVIDGFFVHFFAPPATFLDSVSADFVFVLDKSGSMDGRKFSQMQEGMRTILPQLKEADRFSLVYFSGDIVTWEKTLQQADEDNIDRALKFIGRQSSGGGTNIHGGLLEAMSILEKSSSEEEEEERPAVIVFLTDGHPTAGKINDAEGIKLAIRQRNKDKIKIHSLAFGDDADSTMLKQLSKENSGLYRKIFVASDAALQLDGFYSEIAVPVFSNLKVTYLNSSVKTETITKNRDDGTLYDGSEIVIIGKLKKPKVATLKGKISAKKSDGQLVSFRSGSACFHCCSSFCPAFCGPRLQCIQILPPLVPVLKVSPAELPPNTLGGVIERMWAYQTIKKKLLKAEFNTEKSPTLRNEAKNLAIKYNFVTELTSLVIVDKEAELKPSEDAEDSEADLGFSLLGTIAPSPSGLGLTHGFGGASGMGALMSRTGSSGGGSKNRFGGASGMGTIMNRMGSSGGRSGNRFGGASGLGTTMNRMGSSGGGSGNRFGGASGMGGIISRMGSSGGGSGNRFGGASGLGIIISRTGSSGGGSKNRFGGASGMGAIMSRLGSSRGGSGGGWGRGSGGGWGGGSGGGPISRSRGRFGGASNLAYARRRIDHGRIMGRRGPSPRKRNRGKSGRGSGKRAGRRRTRGPLTSRSPPRTTVASKTTIRPTTVPTVECFLEILIIIDTRPGFWMTSKESELFNDFRSKLSTSGKIDGKLVLAYLTSDSGDVEIKLFEQISTGQFFSTNRKTIENTLDTLNQQKGDRHLIFIHGRQMIPSSLKKLVESQKKFTIVSAQMRQNATSTSKRSEVSEMSPQNTVFEVDAEKLFNKVKCW